MIIRKMTDADVKSAAEIENLCFVHPWSEQSIKDEMDKENSVFLMAFENEKPIGYVGLSVVFDEGYMGNLAVIEEYRRKGVGRMLMKELICECKKLSLAFATLEVRDSNTPAVSLYKSLGFDEVGRRKNYYKEPLEDAILLTKFFK
ncbi:MAG: ribosomal protein S18-alanine N-acetyltransferase [Clostridia bacterium]|nr:ribosomal protein S18-alanine N-acetyltransferase [Clostridia bacterium]